ncbi:hypothetical protein HanRHA438_Chr10g0478841 [Helianthus annuus]|nr:hypothetical protein HanRHA438_Chr10g0478841 [Helianthus annuus]
MDSADTGGSDTTDPRRIVSDDLESSEHEVYTSDSTSTDEHTDDSLLFVLPDGAYEPIDGDPAEYLPIIAIPALIPLALYPAYDLPIDDEEDDVDMFEEEPFEEDAQGEALPAADPLLIADAPAAESPAHSPVADSFESVASVPAHAHSAQHFSHGSDSDQAFSVAPIPSFTFDHEDVEDSDPMFPPGFDPDRDLEFVPMDHLMEDPVDPVDPVDPIDPDFEFEMAFDDVEPAIAPEQAAAFDPLPEHDPVHADIPLEPVDVDPPVDVPVIEGDHVVVDPIVPLPVGDIPADPVIDPDIAPVDPVIAPIDPLPIEPEHDHFAEHMDPPDEEAQHGWIPADEDVPPFPPHHTVTHHADFSFQIPPFVPPAGPGEGSSAHPFGHVPMPLPFTPQIPSDPFTTAPFRVAPFDPTRAPLLWAPGSSMPPTDPYHRFHVGHTIEDVLMSFVYQHESHEQRLQELERAYLQPCQCHGRVPSPLQPSRPLPLDYAARLTTLEQQFASIIRTQQAMEADWLELRRLFYTHFPPPPPPSA